MNINVYFLCGNHRQLDFKSVGAFMNCVVFPKISGLCQEHKLPWNLLEKLGEVFKNNFLTIMQDLKQRIKAGTVKKRCHTISERSLARKLKFRS